MRIKVGNTQSGDRTALELIAGTGLAMALTDTATGKAEITMSATGSGGSTLNVLTYGATAYSTAALAAAGTDSTAAIQATLDAANALGGGIVFIPIGFYRVATHLNGYGNITVHGDGMGKSVLVFDDVNDYALDFTATFNTSSTFTGQTLAKGGRAVTLASAAAFAVGDQVLVNDATLMPGGTTSYTRWITRIANITGNVVTFTERSPATYAVSPGTVQKVSTGMLANVRVSDITFMVYAATYNTLPASRSMGLRIQGCWAPHVERVEFLNFAGQAVGNANNTSPLFLMRSRGARVIHARWEKVLDPAANSPSTQSTPVYITDCTDAQFLSCYMEKCGFGPAFTRSPYCAVIACDIGGAVDIYSASFPTDDGGRGIQTQGGDNYLRIIGNIIHDISYNAIALHDCSNAFIVGNQIVNSRDQGIYSAPWDGSTTYTYCTDLLIANNVIDKTTSTSAGSGMQIGAIRSLIANNQVLNTQNHGIIVDGTGHVISNNLVSGYCQAGLGLAGIMVTPATGGAAKINDNVLSGNGGGGCLSIWQRGTPSCLISSNIVDTTASILATDVVQGKSVNIAVLAYSASMTPDAFTSSAFRITVTNGTAMTINNPTNPSTGDTVAFTVLNSSGGAMGVITWGAAFLLAGAFVNPLNTKRRTIAFTYDGTNWVEQNRAAADI